VGRDHIMTLVDEGHRLAARISVLGSKHRKHAPLYIQTDRLGASYLFDFDEVSRRLAFVINTVSWLSNLLIPLTGLLQGHLPSLHIHESNGQKFSSLPPILLEGFPFKDPHEFAHLRFLPKGKTLVFSDSVGQMALYSLLSNQFR
jgi:hypothetical protein